MALIASSTRVPMPGCGALAFRCIQRASFGTQKMLAARYSSGSSGLAPCAFWPSSSACFASKASEMYLRKIKPRTTCLYSAASMLLRRASAAAQSFASRPCVALGGSVTRPVLDAPVFALRAILSPLPDVPDSAPADDSKVGAGSVLSKGVFAAGGVGFAALALGHPARVRTGAPTPDRSHVEQCARATLSTPRAAPCSSAAAHVTGSRRPARPGSPSAPPPGRRGTRRARSHGCQPRRDRKPGGRAGASRRVAWVLPASAPRHSG